MTIGEIKQALNETGLSDDAETDCDEIKISRGWFVKVELCSGGKIDLESLEAYLLDAVRDVIGETRFNTK